MATAAHPQVGLIVNLIVNGSNVLGALKSLSSIRPFYYQWGSRLMDVLLQLHVRPERQF
jgi:hypothetical protein